jgi:hypothetical protein
MIVVSIVFFLLSIGFCAVGLPGGAAKSAQFTAGLVCLGLSALLFVIAVIWLIAAAVRTRRNN